MSNLEVYFSGVDFIDFGIFLFEELESEFVFFLGSETESVLLDVLNEVILEGGEWFVVGVASVMLESSECGGFANELHCKLINKL